MFAPFRLPSNVESSMSTTARLDPAVCPQCGSYAPQEDGLRRWCERCNWNVAADIAVDDNLYTRSYRRLGERRGSKVLATLIATPAKRLRPRRTLATVSATAIAVFIHLVSLGIFAAGIVLAFTGYPDPPSLIAAACCIGMAWLLLPRPMPMPKKTEAPGAFPAFRALVNDIAANLGGVPIAHIVIDEEFNASYAVAGWRRRPVLHLGLPLWIALAPQERVAVIAHEVAHGVNRDSSRGFLIGSALNALGEWIELLRPCHDATTLSEAVARYLTWIVALPLIGLHNLLLHLLWQEKQRAEYFADYLAARVAGTSGTVGLLRRFALGEHLQDVLLRHAYSTEQSGSYILSLFRDRLANLPARERERMRRATEAEGARLDNTHPPTASRIAFLQAHTVGAPSLVVTAAKMAAIDAEFSSLEDKLGGRLIARYARD
jgi:Zn-dependent protease with chaperone function